MSTFQSLSEVMETKGLFCSLSADRGSHYWHTPEAGGKVDKTNPTQVGRALSALGVENDSSLLTGGERVLKAYVWNASGPTTPGTSEE